MKQAISLLLILCLLLIPLGCSGPKKAAAEPALTPRPFAPSAAETPEAQAPDEEGSESIPAASSPTTGSSPADAYARYMEVKNQAYDRLSKKLEENEELFLSAGMALLPIAMIDLSLIPLSIIGVEGGEAALGMLGVEDVTITQSGGGYALSYQDEQGRLIGFTCEYDAAADSLRSSSTRDGQEILAFEFTRIGESYASQYHAWDENAKDYSLITAFFDADNISAFGISTVAQKQKSIFKGGGLSTDFVINEEGYFILEGDKLTAFTNGEVKTY